MNRFFLGAGSQKAGTTWLHRYLQQFPNFDGGIIKEYHVWDGLDMPELRRKRLGPPTLWQRLRQSANSLVYRMQTDPDCYFDYFAGLLDGGVDMTADITPSYSGLTAARFAFVKENFEKRGIECRALMLIRDPVSRIKSAVRFDLNRGNFADGITEGETDFVEALRQYYKTPYCEVRTRYHETITRLERVFDESEYHVGIYENLFEEEGLTRLSEFLGVEPQLDFASVKVGKTAGDPGRDEQLEEAIRAHYADVYAFCNERFPQTREVWR